MANFFQLELDTSPPVISITAPSYTVPHIDTEIIISSDEPLDNYQEFFIVDSAGTRHDVIFDYLGDSFRGVIDFWDYALGIATIYARVRDEMHNLSQIVMATIDIKKAAQVFITIKDIFKDIQITENIMPLAISQNQREVQISETTREVMLDEMTRKVEVAAK